MKLARFLATIGLALLMACTSTPEPGSSGTPTPTATSPSPSPTATSQPATASQIVYSVDDRITSDRSRWEDIYLYDVTRNTVRRLTSDGERVAERLPRFHGSQITFTVGTKDLVELDPATGQRHRILSTAGSLASYAWSPDGKEVAYIEVLDSGMNRLRLHSVSSGQATTLKNLGTVDGRGTSDLDAVTIAWSKTGDRLLVNDTYPDTEPTVRLVRRRGGGDVITPVKNATNATWSADERSIYLLNVSGTGSGGDKSWQRLDIRTQRRESLALQAGSFHAALSPDGTRLSATTYDRERNAHSVYVLDLTSGKQIRVASGYRDAVWLDAQTLALTRVVACTSGSTCEYYGYKASGTRRVTLTRAVSQIALGSTLWDGGGKPNVDVRYA